MFDSHSFADFAIFNFIASTITLFANASLAIFSLSAVPTCTMTLMTVWVETLMWELCNCLWTVWPMPMTVPTANYMCLCLDYISWGHLIAWWLLVSHHHWLRSHVTLRLLVAHWWCLISHWRLLLISHWRLLIPSKDLWWLLILLHLGVCTHWLRCIALWRHAYWYTHSYWLLMLLLLHL